MHIMHEGSRKMVFILHRYIFRELMKVFSPAVMALTLILSLGMILRPVQEYGVGPRQVIHLMGYFLPIVLTFALPMGALFATALVYGRLAGDNELDACRASGIGLLTLIYPGMVLAIVVAIANLILSFYAMPVFVHRAVRSLKADAKQILFRNIQRRGYYELPPDNRFLIYADYADPQSDTLWGVVVIEVKNYGIRKIIDAESATVHFSPHERFNEVQVTAHNTSQIGPGDEGWFSAELLPFTAEFGSLLRDDIKFKKIDEIKKIRDVDLMRFYPIEKLAREVYAQFTTELLAQDISDKITKDANSSYELLGEPNSVKFSASRCSVQDERTVELSGEVVTAEYDTAGGRLLRTLRCTKASLYVEGDELAPTLTMYLHNPTWRQPDDSEGRAYRFIVRGLILPKAVIDKFKTEDVLESVSPASITSALQKKPSNRLTRLQNELNRKIRNTLAEIEAEIHSRLVFGTGCVPMILIGIGLGIIKKGGHLLAAFGASCVPAGLLILGILMGRNVTTNLTSHAGSGIMSMWAGVVFLSLLVLVIYRKLLKN
jgi:lipopolysaccharide export LptBFGC system permease protein LptF